MNLFAKVVNPPVRLVARILIGLINLFYGYTDYRRFFVLETVARIPYFSYLSVLHLYQSLGRHPSLELMDLHYKETVNEEYHLLIMEELGGDNFWLDRWLSRAIGVSYYWAMVILFILVPKSGYYMMELIEQEAARSYQKLIDLNRQKLSQTKPGRIATQYFQSAKARMIAVENQPRDFSLLEVFESIRDDELVHVQDMSNCGKLKNFASYPESSELI